MKTEATDHDLLDRALHEAAVRITGDPNAPARPGQVALAHHVLEAMSTKGEVAGCAPTGTGKGVAYSLPAFLRAALHHERSVISTESKALQDQLVGKDLVLVNRIVADLTGQEVDFAILKGFSNYGCVSTAYALAGELLESLGQAAPPELAHPSKGSPLDEEGIANNAEKVDALATTMTMLSGEPALAPRMRGSTVVVDRREHDVTELADLTGWVLLQAATGDTADRAEYSSPIQERSWSTVSVTPDECAGKSCPLFAMCPAVAARNRASQAQVVVTNHTLLSIQAALAVPVVLSSQRLGMFDHLIVDEAHALPSAVRDSGAQSISGLRMRSLAGQVDGILGSSQGSARDSGDTLVDTARRIGEQMEVALGAVLLRSREDVVKFTPEDHPLAMVIEPTKAWVDAVRLALPNPQRVTNARAAVKIRRLRSALTSLLTDLDISVDPESDVVRWVESTHRGPDRPAFPSLKFSPVDVAPAIARNLFQTAAEPGADDDEEDGVKEMIPLSVTMVSATLPPGFVREVGMSVDPLDYASPFDAAYGASLLFVPRVTSEVELAEMGSRRGSRWSVDVSMHPSWALNYLLPLVRANDGRALILTSTARTGKLFAQTLRTAGVGHTVYSQWDGMDARQVVAAWREDVGSVLVGTRSMMTGVDAAGETCSLVVVDRVPRNPGNVVDDARVEILQRRNGVDKWSADRSVYVADAALLLEQAAGRLIRRVSDGGMVAVLDPRLMRGVPLSYPESTRALLMSALRRFPNRTGDFNQAMSFLQHRRIAA